MNDEVVTNMQFTFSFIVISEPRNISTVVEITVAADTYADCERIANVHICSLLPFRDVVLKEITSGKVR